MPFQWLWFCSCLEEPTTTTPVPTTTGISDYIFYFHWKYLNLEQVFYDTNYILSRTHLLGPLQGIFSSKNVIRCIFIFYNIYERKHRKNKFKHFKLWFLQYQDSWDSPLNSYLIWKKSADWQELLDSLFNEDGNYTGLPRPSYPRPPTTATTARPPTTATTATTKAATTASHTGGTADHVGETTTMQVLIYKIFNLLF